jgi:hypothetical protein
MGVQLTPPISPECHECTGDVFRGVVCQDILKNGTYHIINEGSKMAHNVSAPGPGIVFLAKPLLRSSDEGLEALQKAWSIIAAIEQGGKGARRTE